MYKCILVKFVAVLYLLLVTWKNTWEFIQEKNPIHVLYVIIQQTQAHPLECIWVSILGIDLACELCEYKTARRGDLTSHMLSHSKDKPYVCPCGFRTARPAHLKRHMAVHNGNRPFACTFCNSYFTRSDDLKKHIKIHIGERNHPCPHCNYTALAQSTLRRHLRRKHAGNKSAKPEVDDVLKTPCPYCEYKAKTSRSLNSHIKRRHINPSAETSIIGRTHFLCSMRKLCFVCFHCDYRTGYLSTLRSHITTEHDGGNWKAR